MAYVAFKKIDVSSFYVSVDLVYPTSSSAASISSCLTAKKKQHRQQWSFNFYRSYAYDNLFSGMISPKENGAIYAGQPKSSSVFVRRQPS